MSEIKTLPILPLRDIVVFPHQPVPLFVGREKSVRALEEAMRGEGKQILLATQKDKDDDDPAADEDVDEVRRDVLQDSGVVRDEEYAEVIVLLRTVHAVGDNLERVDVEA